MVGGSKLDLAQPTRRHSAFQVNSMTYISAGEKQLYSQFTSGSSDEEPMGEWIERHRTFGLVVTEGFEERSVALLRKLTDMNVEIPQIAIGRYTPESEMNMRHREEFDSLAERKSGGSLFHIANHDDGMWIQDALNRIECEKVVVDSTGLSNSGIFGMLDSINESDKDIYVAYSEADQYWPKEQQWTNLLRKIDDPDSLAELVDEKRWLFSDEHSVNLVVNHEGFDSPGSNRALLTFLPYKRSRLAALLHEEDYSEVMYIAGVPRLKENAWRVDVLEKLNHRHIIGRPITRLSTFGYRATLYSLFEHFFGPPCMVAQYNLHLAILGSKLQTIGCWAASRIVPSISIVTSKPTKFYPDAYSEGCGETWFIKLHQFQ